MSQTIQEPNSTAHIEPGREGHGIHVEHWGVIQDEATQQQSKSGNPMFGPSFPK
jgi:predicted SnoaL-like aldol condensation-catalyzing enzyme